MTLREQLMMVPHSDTAHPLYHHLFGEQLHAVQYVHRQVRLNYIITRDNIFTHRCTTAVSQVASK